MEVGSSQLAAAQEPQKLTQTERKSRHKKKRKECNPEELEEFASAPALGGPSATQHENSFAESDSTWPWISLAESSVSDRPPVFTNDCRYFFSIAGTSVRIYATATGQVISTLSSSAYDNASTSFRQADSHTGDITAALINPQNAFQLITASLDGRIRIWDYLEGSLLSTLDVGEPITHMCAHAVIRGHVIIATTPLLKKRKKDTVSTKERSKVYRVSLSPSKSTVNLPVHEPSNVLKVGNIRSTTGLAVSPSGKWLVATGGPKAYVCTMDALNSGFTKFVSNEALTCLAFHPIEEYFATGDQQGQIRLWYCLDAAHMSAQHHGVKRAQTTTLHWHAHAVSSIAFTPNGSYLLSGGEEAVLVIWQLHTGKREFVPRVGAPILSVAVVSLPSAQEEYLLVLADGTLTFVGAGTLRVSKSIARIKLDPNCSSSGPAPLALHKQTSTLILPSSHPSSLLIYSPLTSTLLAELEVSPSNRVSRQDEKPIEPSRVDHIVASDSGEWLATIDRREGDDDFGREIYMKIWQWDSPTSSWSLNSRIDRPHGTHKVNNLTFAPSSNKPLLVSAGDDGNIKVWRIRIVHNKGENEVFWVCRSTIKYRSQIPTDVVCSPDGSLLAVGYGAHAVVFELSSNLFRVALTCPEVKEVSHLAFVGSGGRYIVVADPQDIVLWDLVTMSIRWQYSSSQPIQHVVPHPKSDSFVVIYRDHRASPTLIRTFNTASSTPLSSPTLPFNLRRVMWYPYLTPRLSSRDEFTLVGITESWNTVVFGDRISVPEEEGSTARGIPIGPTSHRRNIFEDIFGKSAFQDFSLPPPSSAPPAQDRTVSTNKESSPLNAPAYLLPPLHTLFAPLLDSLLQKRIEPPLVQEQAEQEEVEDQDMVMADPPAVSDSWVPREKGMEEFIELFKQQTFSSGQDNFMSPRKNGQMNGNGALKTDNGPHRHDSRSSAMPISSFANGKNHPPENLSSSESVMHSKPAVIGKKRKKSIG